MTTLLKADNEGLRREVERLTTENARFRLEYPKAVDHLDKAAGLMRRFSTLHQNDGGKLAEDNRVFLAEIGKP